MAKNEADKIVGEARTKAERLESESKTKAERLESDARTRAQMLDAETAERRQQLFGDLEKERDKLNAEVENLRSFEREYRSRLKSYFRQQLEALEGNGDARRDAGRRRARHPSGSSRSGDEAAGLSPQVREAAVPSGPAASARHGAAPRPLRPARGASAS